ncbi:hypothetical protein A9Q79_07895 [Methylophaga sp. 42_25_T18]|nr:hypothetical protein A9Q79_07895 [Methylophaga sp. 42_25_T18]
MNNIPWKNITLLWFSLSVLLPQGVGIAHPFGLPSLDLPRISTILLFITFCMYLVVKRPSIASVLGERFKTRQFLAFIIIMISVSAIFSESPGASFLWVIGDTFLFFGFAFITLFILSEEGCTKHEFITTLLVIGTILILWTSIELILQENLILNRPTWDKSVTDIFLHLKRFWLMPVGPYGYVQSLALALALFGPVFLVLGAQYNRYFKMFFSILFIVVLFATQCVSAIMAAFAFAFAIVIVMTYKSTSKLGWWLIGILMLMLYLIAVFFPISNDYFSWIHFATYLVDGRGSFGARFDNNLALFQHMFYAGNWFLGYGPGSLMDLGRVVTSVYDGGWDIRTDPGSVFIWFIESGIVVGSLILYMMVMAIVKGLKATDAPTQGLTIGLIGFFTIALSSQSPYLWGVALVYIGMIEVWTMDASGEGNLN